MKISFASLFFLGVSSIDAAAGQEVVTFPCPAAGNSFILPITPPPSTESSSTTTTIRLPKVSNPNGLCILLRRAAGTGNRRAHVARSYADRQWERVAGIFAQPEKGVAVDCEAGGAHECDVTLPSLPEGYEYVLESHDTTEPRSDNEAARFLEQATFGGSLQDIQSLASTGNNFHAWLDDQINVKPTSSIRAFYRSHTNPKFEFPYNTGAVSKLPCEKYSRWRRYAITSRDCLKERKTKLQKHLEVKAFSWGYGIFVDGLFRTMTESIPIFGEVWGGTEEIRLNYRYRIGSTQEANWRADCINCAVLLWDNATQSIKYLPNPEIKFSGVPSSINPYNTVNLPEMNTIDLPSIDNGEEWPAFATWVHPNEEVLLNTTALEDTNQCDGFPSFHIPVPHDEEGAPKGAFPTVFGSTPSGIEFAYDPHLALQENTVDNPLPDGGGRLSIATQGLWRGQGTGQRTPGEQVMCQNVEPNFLNEEGCKISYLKEACSPSQYPDEMIFLNEETVAGIREMTSKNVYIVENLEIDEVLDLSSLYGAPCGDGAHISRWIMDEADLLCESSVVLGEETVRMFRALIDARGESAVPNAQLVDVQKAVFPIGLQCSSADKTKTNFGSILASDGTCWRHVHHQEHSVVDFSGMLPNLDPTGEAVVYEAEDQTLSGAAFKTSKPGFSGTGYADYGADDGYYVEFSNVDGGSGGWCILNFRYSMGSADARPLAVTLNGEYVGELAIATTVDSNGLGSWYVWEEETFVTVCDAGMNTIRVTSTVDRVGGPNLDYMSYQDANQVGGIDIQQYIIEGSNFVSVPSVDAPIIGRLGDHIMDNLVWPFNTQAITDAFKTVTFNPLERPVLVCGSPEEAGSDPFNGDKGFDITVPENEGFREKSIWELSSARHTSWTELALHAKDSLRQKMAWSLSQIIAVGLPGSGMVFYEETEQFIAFYDIFIRNALGSYRDILKEVSFNKIMAKWLSFYGNTSLQYNIENKGEASFPDENYAREIMQLFSIGLYKLNMDGTKVMDESGSPIETYRIEDIVSYARAWTGFVGVYKRGGTSTSGRRGDDSLDPMKIDALKRDLFPKSDLSQGFIGDRSAPLCSDLPSEHALRKGAVWTLLGSTPSPRLQEDPDDWGPQLKRSLVVNPDSPLFNKLCQSPTPFGDCTFPASVILDVNLSYDPTSSSEMTEKTVDTIRTVQIKKPGLATPVFYEYKRQPCVEYSFFDNGVKLVQARNIQDQQTKPSMCGNPRLAIAAPQCCPSAGSGHFYCNYQGERMTFASAQEMCLSHGEDICQTGDVSEESECGTGATSNAFRSWSSGGCEVRAKVDLFSGEVAIVHNMDDQTDVEAMVDKDTSNFFKVSWDSSAPSMNDCLASSSCIIHEESCICSTAVIDHQVFLSADEVSSTDELMENLYTGAVDPATFNEGHYSSLGSCNIPGVTVYSKAGAVCSRLDKDTVFALEVKNKQYFLKNSNSKVLLTGTSSSFRNPVMYNSLADPEVRDMLYETDEAIDSLFYHPSHPPFLSVRLLQRFGLSNPSPGLVERVATAYSEGSYDGIGSGKYGDLGALVAAVLLDDESRKVVLDHDPSHGHIREPLVKLLSFFRSMGIAFDMPLRIPSLLSLEGDIGQGSFESPSVFSFFLPEFQPNSPTVQSAGLVSPESMVLQGSRMLYQFDATWNLIKFGFTDSRQCGDDQGETFSNWRNDVGDFGFKLAPGRVTNCASTEGDVSLSPAIISYQPSSTLSVDDLIEELSMLLTSGRLSDRNKALVRSSIEPYFSAGDKARATRIAQQLLFSAPEHHATSVPRVTGVPREAAAYDNPPEQPYKALVVYVMNGGCDSFNLLVPKNLCQNGDGYNEYVTARGSHALAKESLITIDAPNQNCQEFGVYDALNVVGDLYNNGEALFFANTGVLSKPMNKNDDWVKETSFQLFAHNTMLHEYATGDPYEVNAGTGVFGRMLDKLRLKGYHTSANNANGGESALIGDQYYNNPVNSVSSTTPSQLNKIPSIDNLVDLVKQLNGNGERDNNYLSETFSERVASALADHEANIEVASNPQLDLPIGDYGGSSKDDLNNRFWAVARHMKSRAHRKVNRDIYFVAQRGYDLHASNTLSSLFGSGDRRADENERGGKANDSLQRFIQFLKDEGLWNSTAILMASDFGRSLNPNSGGGTDHGWGGNYFLAGGTVNGKKILGEYPSPLSPEHPNWIGRGRFIPTTPWDAVWNGIAQWLGVDTEEDLDWILPNRQKFGSNLFTGHDLFTDSPVWTPAPVGPSKSPTSPPTPVPTFPSPTASPVVPTTTPLQFVGDGGVNLGLCQGDCDTDGDCQPGLRCMQRSNYESVPGCSGSEFDQKNDYCYARPSQSHLWIVGDNGVPASAFPLHSCDGDCDSNDDCFGDLICLQRGGDEEVPGCIGNGFTRKDFCYDPNPNQTPQPTPQPISPTPPPSPMQTAAPPPPTKAPSANPTSVPTSEPTNAPSKEPTHEPSKSPALLTSAPTQAPRTIYQAEDQSWDSSGKVGSSNAGWTGEGYANMGGKSSWVQFDNVDGGTGGACTLGFRYSVGSSLPRFCTLKVNGVDVGTVPFSSTESWSAWGYDYFETTCLPGNNVIRITASTSEGGPNLDRMDLLTGTTNTPQPTNQPTTSAPTNLPTPKPTSQPSASPTPQPTSPMTADPTPLPTVKPTSVPTSEPTNVPSKEPTHEPSTSVPTSEPTNVPSKEPTHEPSKSPTPVPTSEPTNAPSKSASANPTPAPTSAAPTTSVVSGGGSPVASVVGKSSTITPFGCVSTSSFQAIDENTNPMKCTKTGGPLGFVLSPFHKQLSNVHGIRVYGSKHYPSRDPVTYVLEGRVDPGSPWQLISEGDFPWINQSNPPRNPSRNFMYSTYENGDSSRTFTEVVIPAHDGAYLEYKVTVTTRTSSESELKFAEIELPGDVLSKVTTYEAEDQTVVSGEIQRLYGVSYVTLAGAYVEFPNVDGGSGGNCVLSVNYSNSRSGDKPIEVSVNGNVVGTFSGAPTISAADWNNEIIETTCAPGMNSIRLTGIANSGPNVNKLVVYN